MYSQPLFSSCRWGGYCSDASMPLQHSQGYCPTCQRPVLIQRDAPNHLVHALVSLFLCGLWLPVWLLVSMGSKPWLCSQCGTPQKPAGNSTAALAAVAGILLLVLVVIVMSETP